MGGLQDHGWVDAEFIAHAMIPLLAQLEYKKGRGAGVTCASVSLPLRSSRSGSGNPELERVFSRLDP
jgi:hypothetical protein